jgi:ABC-type sulfate transport system permease component
MSKLVLLLALLALLFFVFSPIVFLVLSTTIGAYSDFSVSFSREVVESTLVTLFSSILASAIAVTLGVPSAYFIARSESRTARLVEALIDLPSSIPHPIVGIAILLFFSSDPLRSLLEPTGFTVLYTLQGMVIAQLVVSSPITVKSMINTFRSMPLDPEIIALTMGASRLKVFFKVVLPLSSSGVVNAFTLTLARAVSEFGSISVLTYYLAQPPFVGVKPAPVLIWDLFETYGLKASLPASLTLLAVSSLITLTTKLSERRP